MIVGSRIECRREGYKPSVARLFGRITRHVTPETTVRIDCRIGAAADLIAYFLPQAVPPMIRRGVLTIEEQDDTETEVTHES